MDKYSLISQEVMLNCKAKFYRKITVLEYTWEWECVRLNIPMHGNFSH